jgi:resuscitation-promoting factor RpfA
MARHAYPHAHLRPHGRHRRPSRDRRPVLRAAVAAGGLTATALVAAESFATVADAATANDFARLRMCESSGDYSINTGNGFYGAYQFDLTTWHGLGYSGLPSDASPATQDEAARRLEADRGWEPWPACSAQLGLGSGGSDTTSVSTTVVTAAVSRTPAPLPAIVGPGPYRGQALSTHLSKAPRADVRALQRQLLTAGYVLAVDGYYGEQTARTVRRFQHAAGLPVDGVAGPKTFARLF